MGRRSAARDGDDVLAPVEEPRECELCRGDLELVGERAELCEAIDVPTQVLGLETMLYIAWRRDRPSAARDNFLAVARQTARSVR